MDLIPLIAERLRELRCRHMITQQECADLAGLGFKFYQRVESGKKKQIWLETVEKLASAFGLEVWEFLGPELPGQTQIKKRIVASSTHYRRRRRGPYYKGVKGSGG